MAEERTLIVQLGCAAAQQSARQAGIAEVQLRGFDQPLSAIAEPWRQEFHQEQTFHQCSYLTLMERLFLVEFLPRLLNHGGRNSTRNRRSINVR